MRQFRGQDGCDAGAWSIGKLSCNAIHSNTWNHREVWCCGRTSWTSTRSACLADTLPMRLVEIVLIRSFPVQQPTYDLAEWEPSMNNESTLGGIWGLSVIIVTGFVYFMTSFTFWQSLYVGVFWPIFLLQTHLFPTIDCIPVMRH